MTPTPALAHLQAVRRATERLERQLPRLDRWAARLATTFGVGGKLLAAGNGGSAAEAQHLTAELIGRFRDDRAPLAAIALHTDTSSITAIGNDYGFDQIFARQVRALATPDDVVLLLSTSGRSPNVLQAAHAAGEVGAAVLALTGRGPNPLAELSDDALCIDAATTATVQEMHLVVVHLLTAAVEAALRGHNVRTLHRPFVAVSAG